MQGARVWLQEQDQLQPCTVGLCANGNVLFTSDYGMVSEVCMSLYPMPSCKMVFLVLHDHHVEIMNGNAAVLSEK